MKSGNPKNFSKTKKEFRQPQFILDMTVNHKTYGGMNLSFLCRNLIKHEIWDSVSFKKQEMSGSIAQLVEAPDC